MNREQRRAFRKQITSNIKQLQDIQGFDITTNTLNLPIADSDETITIDTQDMGVIFSIWDLINKFSNIEESYKEDYTKAFGAEADINSKFNFMKKVVTDFSDAVENIFGEGSCKKIFRHKYPNLVQISEFIEDFVPIAKAIIAANNVDIAQFESQGGNNIVPMA